MSSPGRKQILVPKEQTRFREKTILIEAAPIDDLPQSVGPTGSEPEYSPWSRLHHLYRITKLLVKLENTEETIGAILGIVSNTLPLRSAVLIDTTAGYPQFSVWNTEGVSELDIRAARNRAAAAYNYLTGSTSTAGSDPNARDETDLFLEKDAKGDKKFSLVIPLVVDRRPIFGAFQLECAEMFDESDLMFVNAIANQLAVALDRHKALQQEIAARAEAETAERRMRFLADASRLLAASFDYRSMWENMARLAVPQIADYCFIDILQDQSLRRIAVPSADQPADITEEQVDRVLAGVVSEVMRTRRAVIHPGTAAVQVAIDKEEAWKSYPYFQSYICVPLLFDEHALGTLTLVSVHSDHLYKTSDLALLQDLARRAVVAFENAHLYADRLQAIRSRDDVLNAVSHDLKGPLTVVLGYVHRFLAKGASEEFVLCNRKQIEAIQRSAARMNTLIDDLLDTARIAAQHLHVERQECPITPLVTDGMDLPHSLAMNKAVELLSELAPDLPSVLVDRPRILQVFANLIGNAIKFTPPGGTITVRAEQLENEIQFSVEDTGTGISEEEMPHIFERFWQSRKTARLGTGLGLFIVKGIVDGHGGRIWVQSQLGAGTKFFFTLPLGVTPPPAENPID